MNKKYYVTTTLPYVNADPHIGFALEIIQADALARYHKLCGDDVFFNTGTDEHGVKIYRKAQERGMDILAYVDEYAEKFKKLKQLLNLSEDVTFIRTTNEHHTKAAQEFWKLCAAAGDIYKKNYEIKYCVGCELEKTDSELVDGKCPIHPTYTLEQIEEENYFFRFSRYQGQLLALYKERPDFVVPLQRQNEIEAFVGRGLQDFSISRLKAKMPWGVEVPGDADHVMYVWFDALVNYISTLGWPALRRGRPATQGEAEDEEKFKTFWPGVQVAGKDNLRQQSAMWQAMLMSAELPASKQIFIHGFITSEGQKMSKSVGNVVDPYEIVAKYGVDAARFYLLGALPAYDDGDFSIERFESLYTAHLVNGFGNLTSRILTMLEKYNDSKVPEKAEDIFETKSFWKAFHHAFSIYKFDDAIKFVTDLISACDEKISREKPWEQIKQGKDIFALLYQLAECLRHIAISLLPIIPDAATKVLAELGIDALKLDALEQEQIWGKISTHAIIKKSDILFKRLSP